MDQLRSVVGNERLIVHSQISRNMFVVAVAHSNTCVVRIDDVFKIAAAVECNLHCPGETDIANAHCRHNKADLGIRDESAGNLHRRSNLEDCVDTRCEMNLDISSIVVVSSMNSDDIILRFVNLSRNHAMVHGDSEFQDVGN